MDVGAETSEIWSQMHDRLLGYIRRHVATVQDAEDILQDVFVRIHENLGRLRDTQTITGWIYRIARNAVTDYYRARAKAAGTLQSLAEEESGAQAVSQEHASAGTEAREPHEVLAGCTETLVERLPQPYRDAVALTELEGITQTEAAGRLGLSVSGMKSRVQRGREKLKGLLLDCCHVEFDRRKGVVDFEPKPGQGCDKCDCR